MITYADHPTGLLRDIIIKIPELKDKIKILQNNPNWEAPLYDFDIEEYGIAGAFVGHFYDRDEEGMSLYELQLVEISFIPSKTPETNALVQKICEYLK